MSEQLIEKFISKPWYLGTGSGKLAKQFNVSKEEIYKAKEAARQILYITEKTQLNNTIAQQEEVIATLISERVEGDTTRLEYTSNRPLTRPEIEDLYGIDNISTQLSSYWNKQQLSGKYTISANVKCLIQDFYSQEQLLSKLSELYKNVEPVTLVRKETYNKDVALFIYIADDHAGLQFNSSLFGNQWNKQVYAERMNKILETISETYGAGGFNQMYIVRLGDEADGWNAKTTRQDHSLGSASNKEQFDIFTEVNKQFYDTLFASGFSQNYTVITCNNSNHSGLGLSYIYNKATEFYVQAKYPQVQFLPINDFISYIEWGNHVIGFTHGKDEKLMKAPFPLNLDIKTDLWLYDFYENKGFSPNKRWISTIKGDIHKYNVNEGKSGRYVNVPSISGSSEWIEHNFGNTKPGALIECFHKQRPTVISIPVKF